MGVTSYISAAGGASPAPGPGHPVALASVSHKVRRTVGRTAELAEGKAAEQARLARHVSAEVRQVRAVHPVTRLAVVFDPGARA